MVKFTATKKEMALIRKVVARALGSGLAVDAMTLEMDLTAVNANDDKLDFQKLLDADEFNFIHDLKGIGRNIDRRTGKLLNCFSPRCVARKGGK